MNNTIKNLTAEKGDLDYCLILLKNKILRFKSHADKMKDTIKKLKCTIAKAEAEGFNNG